MPKRYLLFPFALLLSAPALADFNGAVAAYQNKQFETAYIEFNRLAELGDAPSQRNLAAMYARGEHVSKDIVAAWVWAALASEQDSASESLRDTIAKHLTEEQRSVAQSRLVTLREQFGKEAIANRLLPVPAEREADCTVSGEAPAKPLRTTAPRYPEAAETAGISAYTCARFYLDPKGQPKRIRFYDSKLFGGPEQRRNRDRWLKLFEKESGRAISRWQFLPPANETLRELPGHYCIDYKLYAFAPGDIEVLNISNKKNLVELATRADAGDANAQYELAKSFETDVFPGQDKRESIKQISEQYYVKSAINGDSRGQYYIAAKLLTGDKCEKDVEKGILWLSVSAQQGNPEAAWLMAQKLDSGQDVSQQHEKARHWLKIAADAGHPRAKLQYALHLLETDPTRIEEARRYLPRFEETDDLALLEVYARSAALTGDFATAIRYQEQVVSIATELDFARTDRERALASYRAKTLPSSASL